MEIAGVPQDNTPVLRQFMGRAGFEILMSTYWDDMFLARIARRSNKSPDYEEHVLEAGNHTFRIVISKAGDRTDVLVMCF